MIRSTKVSLKFSNAGKREIVAEFLAEYRRVTVMLVDALWDATDRVPSLIPTQTIQSIVKDTWLSAVAQQCAAKQASGIVRGTRQKNKQREYMVNKLTSEGKFAQARKLQRVIDKHPYSKPKPKTINAELDSRLIKVNIEKSRTNAYDGWIKVGAVRCRNPFNLPFRKTRHLNKLASTGHIKQCARLSDKGITLMFEIPDPPMRETGKTVGIDVGINALFSVSDGKNDVQVKADKQGNSMASITAKIANKKKGSKAFQRCVAQRERFIGWACNQLDLNNVQQINIEKIRNLRYGKRTSRLLSHFVYPLIFGRLSSVCQTNGVRVCEQSPTYTSQRCSDCGWTRKANRKGVAFVCNKCGNTLDADVNAARNISFTLPAISKAERLRQPNRKGFYWLCAGQENIVPAVRKTKIKERLVYHAFP